MQVLYKVRLNQFVIRFIVVKFIYIAVIYCVLVDLAFFNATCINFYSSFFNCFLYFRFVASPPRKWRIDL